MHTFSEKKNTMILLRYCTIFLCVVISTVNFDHFLNSYQRVTQTEAATGNQGLGVIKVGFFHMDGSVNQC
jgi:hypothetical protein